MKKKSSSHISENNSKLSHLERGNIKSHRPIVLWFFGLSGSGKTTLANALENTLNQMNIHTMLLDGDNLRAGLNGDLEFGSKDRVENLRRTAEVAKLFYEAGLVVLCSFITPTEESRTQVKNILSGIEFRSVYVECSVEACESRDVKGLYKKARAGEIEQFTGVSAPFEKPKQADIVLNTEQLSVEQALDILKVEVTKIITRP